MNAEHPLPPKQKAKVVKPTAAPQNAEKPLPPKKTGFFARLFGHKQKKNGT